MAYLSSFVDEVKKKGIAIPNLAEVTAKLAVGAAQAIPRAALQTGLTIGTALGGKNSTINPSGVGKVFLGSQPINALQNEASDFSAAHPNIPAPAIALGAAGLTAGNLLPIEGAAVAAKEAGITAVQKLVAAIRSAAAPRKELEAAYTAERAARAAKVQTVFEQGKGQKGYFQGLGSLKGELAPDKKAFESLNVIPEQAPNTTLLDTAIKQEDVDHLFNQIQQHPHLDLYERVSTANGLQKLLDGQVPQQSQLSHLEDVFGSDLIKAIKEKAPFLDRLKATVTDILNVPRSLITSIDMSAPLRQGVLFAVTKPTASAKAAGEMFAQFFSKERFDKWLADIPNNPRYRQMKDSGLYISNPNKVSQGLSGREESFMSNLAERIPVWGKLVQASSRAYVGYLNKLRVDVFTQLAARFEKDGIATPENLKSLASYVNNATGRGDLGKLNTSGAVLNNIFFSPRLIASRFNMLNPVWYAKQTPSVRKEALLNMAKFIGTGATVLAVAKASGADVESDPRSTDFGKIKIGDTRWDIWGGFQQWVRVFSQIAAGAKKTAKGDIVPLDKTKYPFTTRLNVTSDFLRGKLAPVPSLALELMDGQKMFGGDIKLTDEIAQNTVPLYLQDMQQAMDEFGPEALFTTGVPAFFGVGVQTYQDKSKTTDRLGSFK